MYESGSQILSLTVSISARNTAATTTDGTFGPGILDPGVFGFLCILQNQASVPGYQATAAEEMDKFTEI